jgi:hypothetical protein
MGILTKAKGETFAAHARRAHLEGRQVFTPRLHGSLVSDLSGPVPGWAEQIEAIEAEGWALVSWSVVNLRNDRPDAYPLFRRVPR